MFKLFLECEGLCVTDGAEIFDISVPAASQQLKLLEIAGLFEKERMGQMICYKAKRDSHDVLSFKNLLSFYSRVQ